MVIKYGPVIIAAGYWGYKTWQAASNINKFQGKTNSACKNMDLLLKKGGGNDALDAGIDMYKDAIDLTTGIPDK
jgi:hypothetical protein